MPKYIAFLRAINVGGRVVKMDRLRALFEELNFTNVESFIASGNIIFDATAKNAATLETKIEAHLKSSLGYEVATCLRSPAEVAAAAANDPFNGEAAQHEKATLFVGFLKHAPEAAAVEKLMTRQTPTDAFHVAGREVYWLCRIPVNESKIANAMFEKVLGVPATFRNVTTVGKLAAKYHG
jgi:uncharacterized protein (DUF1697 family)